MTPIVYDQFFSAQRVQSSGQGIGTRHYSTLTPVYLAGIITRCLSNEAMLNTAKGLGEELRATDGVAAATSLVRDFMHNMVHTGEYWEKMNRSLGC